MIQPPVREVPQRWQLIVLVAACWFLIDQGTKWWIIEHLMRPPRIIELTSFFNVVLTWNTGFGLLSQLNLSPWVFSGLSLLVMFALFALLGGARTKTAATGFGLILGGAAANVTDRFRRGAVPDFLDFHVGVWHWPAFNFADAGIFCAVLLLLAASKEQKPE